MSSNPLCGLRKVRTLVQLTGAAWSGRCASLCLQAALGGWAAGGSGQWRKRVRGVYTRRCAIQFDDLCLYLLPYVHDCFVITSRMGKDFGSKIRVGRCYEKATDGWICWKLKASYIAGAQPRVEKSACLTRWLQQLSLLFPYPSHTFRFTVAPNI